MKLGYSIIILVVVAVGLYFLTKNGQNNQIQEQSMTTEESQNGQSQEGVKDLGKELLMTVVKEGSGEEAKAGDLVSVNYTGTLIDGTVFDSSIGREPFEFTLGAGQVIKGWDIGVSGMKVGEVRRLSIPADLAYGDRAIGDLIPANSTLIFEVELLEIK